MRINAVIAEQAVNTSGPADILGKLNIGDVVKARVLEITSGELMLKLFDGSVFKAATSSEMETAPGEMLELTLKGRNNGTLIMETVKREQPKPEKYQNDGLKLLDSLHLKADAKNLEIAAAIKSAGLPATRELFEKAAGILDGFKTLTAEKAVYLSSGNITPEPGNINTLSRLMEGTLKLGAQLDELHSLLSRLITRDSATLAAKNRPAPSENPMMDTDSPVPENTGSGTNKAAKPQVVEAGVTPSMEKGSEPSLRNTVPLDASGKGADGITPESSRAQFKAPDPRGNEALSGKPAGKGLLGETLDFIPARAEVLKDAEALLKPLRNADRALGDLSGEMDSLGKLKDSFKSLFIKTDSSELSSELNVKQLYKDILDRLDHIKTVTHAHGASSGEDVGGKIGVIEDGIKLLNQINANSTYIQIPLNIAGFNTTGELYVLKNDRRKKKIDPGNAVMLIALDTQNLGRIETLIDIKDKNVGINLRAEDQQIIDFIKENFRYLYSGLKDRGYRLIDIKYRLLSENTNLMNVEKTVQKTLGTGKVSVDLKI